MRRVGRLQLAHVVDVDLSWDGSASISRQIRITARGPEILSLEDTRIDVLIHSRDIVDVSARSDVGFDPFCQTSTVSSDTLLQIWPGITEIASSTYTMTITYRQLDFASRFENRRLIFCTDSVGSGGIGNTGFSTRQQFTYRVLLPKPTYWWRIPNYLNVVEGYNNARTAWTKDQRQQLGWEWVAEADDRPIRLQLFYTEKPRERLVGWMRNSAFGAFTFLIGCVYLALKPEVVVWIRHLLRLP